MRLQMDLGLSLVTSFPIVYTSTNAPRMCSTARRRRTERVVDPEAHKDFFISYTSADQGWAEWIAWQLEAEGYTTRIQAWDFLAGSNFVHEMDTATKQATRTIAVLSPDYFTSHFTSSEWEDAFARDPRGEKGLLMPVRVRPCDVEGLLKQVVYIDLVDQNEATARATLLRGVKHERRKPSSPPVFPSTPYVSKAPAHPSFPGALPMVWNIPYPRNHYFTGREELLRNLAASLRAGETVGISQPQAVSGLGGVGKTQIALEYAYRYYQDYDAVLWTRADTLEALISGFVAFADRLHLPVQDERDEMKVVQAVKDWLMNNTGWLLLLDNADDLALVRDFLPLAGRGHTLLTTRASSMGRLAHPLEVDALDTEQGAQLLLRLTYRLAPDAPQEQVEASERAIALSISEELGGLPLALDQAGAYIEEMHCSLTDYLQFYRTQRAELLKARGGLVPDHPEPVATTWSLSFDQVEKRSAAAADLLRITAFLHPDAIPEEIITEGAIALGPNLQAVAQNPLAFNQAIGVLLSYSLLKRQPEEHLLSMHRLVQAVILDAMDEHERARWRKQVLQVLSTLFPGTTTATWRRCERLLPHVLLYATETKEQEESRELATALESAAVFLREIGQYEQAESLFQRALRILEQILGPEDLAVASPLDNLADLYNRYGKPKQAEPLAQRALHILEQAGQSEHPRAVYPLTELARTYQLQGKYEQAESLFQRALHILEQAGQSEHPRAVFPLWRLADLYNRQGKYEQAEAFYQRALYVERQGKEPEPARVAYFLESLTRLYRKQSKDTEAEPLYQPILRALEQQLVAHPNDFQSYLERGYVYLRLKMRESACADFAKYAAHRPKDVNAAWMVVYAALGKERPGVETAERLEVIAELDPQSDEAYVCRGVALELRGKLQEGLAELEHALSLDAENENASFWKGVVCTCLGRDAMAMESIEQALKAGLPPILLTPLNWLEQDSPNFYQEYAQPLLKRYELI